MNTTEKNRSRTSRLSLRKALAAGALVVGIGAVGIGLAACSNQASAAESDSSSQSQVSSQTQGNDQDLLASVDSAALAKKLGVSESKIKSALSTAKESMPKGGAPGGQSGSDQQGSGSAPTGQAKPSAGSDGQSGTMKDPVATALATALDKDYETVLAALKDAGYTVRTPGDGLGQQSGTQSSAQGTPNA